MEVNVNDIVQVLPEHKWSGTLVIVEKVKDWGIIGYTPMPMQRVIYIGLLHKDYKVVGQAIYTLK